MIYTRTRAVGALLGACALSIGMGATPAQATPGEDGREAVVYTYDGRGMDVASTVESVVGSQIVATVTIDTGDAEIVSTISTDLAGFTAACEGGAVDGDRLDPGLTTVTTVEIGQDGQPDRYLESAVTAYVYDWDGDFIADIGAIVTIERGYNDRYISFVETKLYDLGIEIGPGGGYEPEPPDCGVLAFDCDEATTVDVGLLRTAAPERVVAKPAGKFVADREGKDFAAYANKYLFHYKVEVDAKDGTVALSPTDKQGPLPPDQERTQRILVDVIKRLINDGPTKVTFIRGNASKDPADHRVVVGSYPQGKIDLDDLDVLGNESPASAVSMLVHELEEQYRKQVKNEKYPEAHDAGIKLELEVIGAKTRVQLKDETDKDGKTKIPVVYTYADGRVIHVIFTVDTADKNKLTIERIDRTPKKP